MPRQDRNHVESPSCCSHTSISIWSIFFWKSSRFSWLYGMIWNDVVPSRSTAETVICAASRLYLSAMLLIKPLERNPLHRSKDTLHTFTYRLNARTNSGSLKKSVWMSKLYTNQFTLSALTISHRCKFKLHTRLPVQGILYSETNDFLRKRVHRLVLPRCTADFPRQVTSYIRRHHNHRNSSWSHTCRTCGMFAVGNGCMHITDSPRDHVGTRICSSTCTSSLCTRSHRPRVAFVRLRSYRWDSLRETLIVLSMPGILEFPYRCNLCGNRWDMCCHTSRKGMVVVPNCIGKFRNHFHPDGNRWRRTCGTSRGSIPRVASIRSGQFSMEHIHMSDNRCHPFDNPRHRNSHGISTLDKRLEDDSDLTAGQV